ncbi:MAG: hypothetical protein GC155_06215 [Alphaproteobacteria bacterium]|nr:hypothetical protein [Alphaproteobacteria bacterium]
MSFKAKAPKEDPATQQAREAAQARADTSRKDETQRNLDSLTRELLRVFGRSSGGGLAGGGGAAGAGSLAGAGTVASGGGSFDPGSIGPIVVDPFSEGGYVARIYQ